MKALKKTGKICLIALLSLILLLVVTVSLFNALKFAIYSDYYSREQTVCKNPGLSDGFVCQGIAVSEEHGKILVSGYMQNKSNSRIYITDFDSNSYYVNLTYRGGDKYTGHAGGVALTADTVYVASGSKLFTFSLSELMSVEPGGSIDIGHGTAVNNAASFVYADESYVYVGEYNDPVGYQKEHKYETPEGTNYAIISRYSHNDLTHPDKIYSIRNYVQGACFTPEGKVILSTSHGLTDTLYYVYNESEMTASGESLDGTPVYYFGECLEVLKAPAMGEDLDYYDGRVISLTESASNKYIFGKFFFAFDIFSLEF